MRRRINRQAAQIDRLSDQLVQREQDNTKLTADLTDVTDRLLEEQARQAHPSFRLKHSATQRIRSLTRDAYNTTYPIMSVNSKTAGYAFAESLGIPTPTRIADYQHPTNIDWSTLPDSFVIKTLNGTSARGVLVLQRYPGGYVDLLSEDPAVLTDEQIVADLARKADAGKVSAELVIEEPVRSPTGELLDMKLYCFYGTVGLVAVIARDARHRLRFRHFWPDGADAGDIRPDRQYDPAIPVPVHLKDLLSAGEKLSTALPEPFVRLDFYEQAEGIVFGEVTPSPGGDQIFRPDVDEHLGSLWEDAEARLRAEAVLAGLHDPRFNTGWI